MLRSISMPVQGAIETPVVNLPQDSVILLLANGFLPIARLTGGIASLPIPAFVQGNRTTKPLKSKNRLNCEQKGEPSCSPIRLTI